MISPKEGKILSIGLGLIKIGIIFSIPSTVSLLIYTALLFLGSGYSVPPLRFKTVPILDLVSHGLAGGPLLFFYGFSVPGNIDLNNPVILASISLYVCSVIFDLRNHLQDYRADSVSGTKTTVCRLGPGRAGRILSPICYPLDPAFSNHLGVPSTPCTRHIRGR